MQSVELPPLQLLHELSQLWQTESESAKPEEHEATQALPDLYGLLESQLMQSVDALPEHVAQSAWQLAHALSSSWYPSGHLAIHQLS